MTFDRFGAMVSALVWRQSDGKYLILKRSEQKDFAAGEWECVTGKMEHGESFSAALLRETREEIGQDVQVEFVIGTAHFYRGTIGPAQEMIGVHYGCSLRDADGIRLSPEHSDYKWVTAQEVDALFPVCHWLRALIMRAGLLRTSMPEDLRQFHRMNGFEI